MTNLFQEALGEVCRVITGFGSRTELTLKDVDDTLALFRDKNNDIVILPLTEIKALEFKDDTSKD